MAELKNLAVEKREALGKGAGRALRTQGLVPGVYYDAKGENVPVTVNAKRLGKLYSSVGKTQVFNLDIDDNGSSMSKPSLIWSVQRHPYKDQYVHIDFFGVDMESEVKVMVPLHVKGTPIGVKNEGGILEVYRDQIEVVALPMDIPTDITIDVSEMRVNDHVAIEDIQLPEGVVAHHDDNFAVLGVIVKGASDDSEEEGEEEVEEEAEA